LTKARIEALTDGIFATVMTVLVLGLSLPQAGLSESGLEGEIVNLSPSILAYVFSFVVLGVYWIGHHNQFHYIKRTDRVFLWVNILFLLTIGFVPFFDIVARVVPFLAYCSPNLWGKSGGNGARTLRCMVVCNCPASSRRERSRPSHCDSSPESNSNWASGLPYWNRLLLSRLSDKSGTLPSPHSILYPTKPH